MTGKYVLRSDGDELFGVRVAAGIGVDEDGFGWEFLGDLVFGAAEDERGEPGAEEIAAFVVLFFFDGVLVVPAKAFEWAKKAGHEKTEE